MAQSEELERTLDGVELAGGHESAAERIDRGTAQ